jgi:hypothetical protein
MSVKKRSNFFEKVKEVQNEFSVWDDGIRTVVGIHRAYIAPKFRISRRTLDRYLQIKLRKETAVEIAATITPVSSKGQDAKT